MGTVARTVPRRLRVRASSPRSLIDSGRCRWLASCRLQRSRRRSGPGSGAQEVSTVDKALDPRERLDSFGPPEPYRVKVVEPILTSTREEREGWLAEAGFNLFLIPAERVTIDLLTDSGTGAMSSRQWAALIDGDESYAGARSYYRLRDVAREFFGLPEVIPTHQGRAAEFLLFSEILKPGQKLLSNTLFDTTRANAEVAGATGVDLPSSASKQLGVPAPFKGDVDLGHLARELEAAAPGEIVGLVMTVTNNAAGGQPVSMANLRGASDLCRRFGVPLILDASRVAENAFFIREREEGFSSASIAQIVRAMGDCATWGSPSWSPPEGTGCSWTPGRFYPTYRAPVPRPGPLHRPVPRGRDSVGGDRVSDVW